MQTIIQTVHGGVYVRTVNNRSNCLMCSMLLAISGGCRGDDVFPEILSLVDANGVKLSSDPDDNTERVSAKTTNTYSVTFSTAMNAATITDDNVTIACDGESYPLAELRPADSAGGGAGRNQFVVELAEQLPPLSECALTFSSGIQDKSGQELEEVTFDFTTRCPSSSIFGDESQFYECWMTKNIPESATLEFGSLIMNFTTVESRAGDTLPFVYKLVEGDFDVVMYVSDRNSNQDWEEIGIMVSTEEPALHTDSFYVSLYFGGMFQNESIYAQMHKDGSVQSRPSPEDYIGRDLYLRITREEDIFRAYYSTNGSSWKQFNLVRYDGSHIGDVATVGIFGATGNSYGNFNVTIDSFSFESGEAVGQD